MARTGKQAHVVATGLAALGWVLACGPSSSPRAAAPARADRPPAVQDAGARPCAPAAHTVAAGAALQPMLDAAVAGDVLCLSPGVYQGPLAVRQAIRIEGPSTAIIRSSGIGTTIQVLAPRAELAGFTVDGSGRWYDKMDAAVYVHANGVVVRGLTVRGALFGLVAELSGGVSFIGNHVIGDAPTPVGIRGDGIRLWEVYGSTVSHNLLEDSRDIVVWYSPGNQIVDNTVVRSRYATHFMYSSDCVVLRNHDSDNIVGVFVMYSENITLADNVFDGNTVPDGMGLGVKESGNLTIRENEFVDDNQCLYLDNSPFRTGDTIVVEDNTFARCRAGVTFHNSESHSRFADNRFEDNGTHVTIEGRGTARQVDWRGNYFDDYRGYDLDGDGYGDVPYESRDLSERLTAAHPNLEYFRGTVALQLVDLAARVLPLLQPDVLFVDAHPRVSPARR